MSEDKLDSELSNISETYLAYPDRAIAFSPDHLMARQHVSYLLGVVHALIRKPMQ